MRPAFSLCFRCCACCAVVAVVGCQGFVIAEGEFEPLPPPSSDSKELVVHLAPQQLLHFKAPVAFGAPNDGVTDGFASVTPRGNGDSVFLSVVPQVEFIDDAFVDAFADVPVETAVEADAFFFAVLSAADDDRDLSLRIVAGERSGDDVELGFLEPLP